MILVDPTFWPSFWPGFWSNLVADFIVGILITGVIAWVIRKRTKIEAKILVKIFRESETTLSFTFVLKNTGRVSFKEKEVVWNIFMESPAYDMSTSTTAMARTNPEIAFIRNNVRIAGENHIHFNDNFDKPLFPGRQAELFEIEVIPQSRNAGLFYFLSTAHGYFPTRHVLQWEKMVAHC